MSDEVTEFTHAGLDCLVIKMDMLGYCQDHYCGYVRVSESHPWYLKDDDDECIAAQVDITYTGQDPRLTSNSTWWVGLYSGSFEETVKMTKRLAESALNAALTEVLQ